MNNTMNFIITGTDTGIGKTIFAAALTNALNAFYWKPIQAGLSTETDSETVMRLGNAPAERILTESYRLNAPASPHLAAKLENITIDPANIPLPTKTPLIIEGAGGLLVPLTNDLVFADLFAKWQIPIILCARTALGTINHTLLSLEAMRQRAIPIFGVAFIGEAQPETEKIIAQLGEVNILGCLPWLKELTVDTLQMAFRQHFSHCLFQESTA